MASVVLPENAQRPKLPVALRSHDLIDPIISATGQTALEQSGGGCYSKFCEATQQTTIARLRFISKANFLRKCAVHKHESLRKQAKLC